MLTKTVNIVLEGDRAPYLRESHVITWASGQLLNFEPGPFCFLSNGSIACLVV